jgi:glycosyltransferase involved in cell wall biosynthesis
LTADPQDLPGPEVSVIIPVKDRRRMLEDCLQGLAAQTFPAERFEVIVLDNQSQEDIEGLVREAAATHGLQVHYSRMDVDRGPVPARNYGAKLARGNIIAFTDSDCRPTPEWLEAGLQHFRDPRVALVSGPVTYKPEQNRTFFSKLTAETLSEHPTYPTANAFYRRKVFLSFGGFDESMSVSDFLNRAVECADTDLAWRVKKAGCENRFAPDALIYHEIEKQSVFSWLMEPTRLILLPLLVRRHPELARQLLTWNVVFYPGTLWVYSGATLVIALLAVDWRLLWLLPAIALGKAAWRGRSLMPARVACALGEMTLHLTRMTILAATLAIGSLRYRRLVL